MGEAFVGKAEKFIGKDVCTFGVKGFNYVPQAYWVVLVGLWVC